MVYAGLSFAAAVAFSTDPLPLGAEAGVGVVVFVAFGAVGFVPLMVVLAHGVLAGGHGLEVVGIAAKPVAAQVVQL